MKILFLVLSYLFIINCKGNDKYSSITDKSILSAISTSDSLLVIDSIDRSSIGKEVSDLSKENLMQFYKLALEKDFERPYMWDIFIPENKNMPKFFNYKKFKINNKNYNSLYVSIKYEDAKYEGILLLMDDKNATNEYGSLMMYENLDSEEKYVRTTKEGNNQELIIELKRDGAIYRKFSFLIQNNLILDYFDKDGDFNKTWGNIEEVDSNNGRTGETREYLLKGKIINHIKSGFWVERRYSIDYDRNIWIDGQYNKGVRDGEWNISPNGPVEKINIYKAGNIIESFNP